MRRLRFTKAIAAGIVLGMFPAALFCQEEHLGGLASEEFAERERAQLQLLEWAGRQPDRGEAWLLREYRAAGDPEVRLRIRSVLRELVVADHQKAGPGYVGIQMDEAKIALPGEPGVRSGVRVRLVVPGTPASKAGLLAGDVIVAFGKRRWAEDRAVADFAAAVKAERPGTTVELSIVRNGELKKIPVVLGPRPMGLPEFGGLLMPNDPKEVEAQDRRAKDAYFDRWLRERLRRDEGP